MLAPSLSTPIKATWPVVVNIFGMWHCNPDRSIGPQPSTCTMTFLPQKTAKPPPKPKPVTAQWLMTVAQFYLSQRIATERQVIEMLSRRSRRRSGVLPDAVVQALMAETVAILCRCGLLDDKAYTVARAATLKRKGLSAGAARARLTAKGIERDLAGSTIATAAFDEEEQIRTIARKLRIGPWARDGAGLNDRDLSKLARRGFGVAAIRRALADVELL